MLGHLVQFEVIWAFIWPLDLKNALEVHLSLCFLPSGSKKSKLSVQEGVLEKLSMQ